MPGWGVIPSIRARDPQRLVEFYDQVLGFTVLRQSDETGNSAVELGDARLMIEPVEAVFYSPAYNEAIRGRAGEQGPHSLYIESEDLDALYERAQASGAVVVDAIAERPWGQREFTIEDPEGNWLTFWNAGG